MKDVLTIYCSKNCQGVAETAEAHGYTAPLYRVGAGGNSSPREGEVVVAMVREGRDSLPIPIFRREERQGE